MHVQEDSLKFHVYFCGMAGKTDTRVTRSYTFTFDTEQDKAEMLAHAKQQGLTLAALIKSLLVNDVKAKGKRP